MNVGELRSIIEELEDDAEVFAVEYGYRSSDLLTTDSAAAYADDRDYDDWGNEKEVTGSPKNLYILVGGWGGNRYPPSGLKEELGVYA